MAFDNVFGPVTVYAEAAEGDQAEREAVAYSATNRKRLGRWSHTLAGVCTDYEQYSCWNGDRINRRNMQRVCLIADDDPVLVQCKAAWVWAVQHPELDPTHGATHYHEKTQTPPPSWTIGARRTLETAHFYFYADVK